MKIRPKVIKHSPAIALTPSGTSMKLAIEQNHAPIVTINLTKLAARMLAKRLLDWGMQ